MPRRASIPDWLLERYAADALSPQERREIELALEADAAQRARLEALRQDDRAVLRAHPASEVVREVRRRLEAAARPRAAERRGWVALPAFAATAAAVALFAARPVATSGPGADLAAGTSDSDRAKGAVKLSIYRVRGQSQEKVEDGGRAAPGDILQIRYVAGGKRYGVIVSIDGGGGATLHLPEEPGASSAIAEVGSAPHGYRLDAAPRFERFIFATSDAPLSTGAVLEAARALASGPDPLRAPLALPAGVRQLSLVLNKVSP